MKLVSHLAIGAAVLAVGGVGVASVIGAHGPSTAAAQTSHRSGHDDD